MDDNNDMSLYIFATCFVIFVIIALCTEDKYDDYGRPVQQFRLNQEQCRLYMAPTVTRFT